MARTDIAKILAIYDYLRAAEAPSEAEPTIIFGRNDVRVAKTAANLITSGLVEAAVISGGFGKDSGDLAQRGYDSEAAFIDEQLRKRLPTQALPPLYLDKEAKNGGDNARNGLRILGDHGYARDSGTAVAHATSLRRLAETVRHEAVAAGKPLQIVYRVPTDYNFDPTNLVDQAEATAEFLRFVDWPAKGWLQPQVDLPEDLVDYVQSTHS